MHQSLIQASLSAHTAHIVPPCSSRYAQVLNALGGVAFAYSFRCSVLPAASRCRCAAASGSWSLPAGGSAHPMVDLAATARRCPLAATACLIPRPIPNPPILPCHSLILLEIQDTLRQPPSTVKTMKKAVNIAVTGAFVFYFTVAVAGYVSLGNGGWCGLQGLALCAVIRTGGSVKRHCVCPPACPPPAPAPPSLAPACRGAGDGARGVPRCPHRRPDRGKHVSSALQHCPACGATRLPACPPASAATSLTACHAPLFPLPLMPGLCCAPCCSPALHCCCCCCRCILLHMITAYQVFGQVGLDCTCMLEHPLVCVAAGIFGLGAGPATAVPGGFEPPLQNPSLCHSRCLTRLRAT
jgi:hypothetical protein